MKRSLIVLLAGAATAACGAPTPEETAPPVAQDIVALAREIHEATLTIDSHDDIPFNFAEL